MVSQEYELVLSTNLADGANPLSAYRACGRLFKMDVGRVAELFASKRRVASRNLDHPLALKCQRALARYGITSEIREMVSAGRDHDGTSAR